MIPSVAEIPIAVPFSVVDIDTGRTLHEYTDGPGDLPPDAAQWPVLSITADAGRVIISTRAPFIALILDRVKRDETRTRDVFRPIVGARVALIETGAHGRPAMIRGYATIGATRRVSYDDTDARAAAGILGTPYDITPGGSKVFYPMIRVRRCRPYPLPADHVNHGRSYCEFTRPAGK